MENDYPWWSASSGSLPTRSPAGACTDAQWDLCMVDDGNPTKRVGSFPNGATPNGLYDLAGNVDEWVADLYAPYTDPTCWNGTVRSDPLCNNNDAFSDRVIRGGSWNSFDVVYVRSASRNTPVIRISVSGFRCARSP